MPNNAELGFTIQKVICDRYSVNTNSRAASQFAASFNSSYAAVASKLVDNIFSELNLKPVECLTLTNSGNSRETLSPHNFILSDGSTFSIRSNMNGDKVAPRVVGQAGI